MPLLGQAHRFHQEFDFNAGHLDRESDFCLLGFCGGSFENLERQLATRSAKPSGTKR
jgi:hypothetical protein